jgi:hypothetical protein
MSLAFWDLRPGKERDVGTGLVGVPDRRRVRRPVAAPGDAQHGYARFGEEILSFLLGHRSWHIFSL